MRFTILTLFPDIVSSYVNESILKRAQENKKIKVEIIDIRKFTKDKHNTADDKPYGGGPGMVMKAEPILKAYDSIKRKGTKKLVVVLSTAGKKFSNIDAKKLSKNKNHIILICGRYEGIDDRVMKALKAVEISVGEFVLTGGEIPALVLVDAISRQIPGVLGKYESVEENRDGAGVPAYTRPETFVYKKKKYSVPKELASGNHAKIEEWRRKNKK